MNIEVETKLAADGCALSRSNARPGRALRRRAGIIVPSLRTALSALEPGATLSHITMLPSLVATSLARDRFIALLLSGLAALAVLLSAVGVFGVISTEIARRRKEIGIRMLRRRALARAAVGVAGGTALALLLARLMKSLLFGVSA